MHAEVISIGDELTSGLSLDTNAQWLSRRLAKLGIWAMYHTTVADQLPAIVDVLRAAIDRADVVVVTGGLGPTADDLTRQALATTLGRPLICDEGALDRIRCLFARRGREMPERNKLQAMLPEGSRLVPNPHGTAPGIAVETVGRGGSPVHVYCLPGVPAEMREMWERTLEGELGRLGGGRVILTKRLRCFGAGESAIEAMLPDLIRRGRHPQVGITASGATITLSVTADGTTEDECRAAMEPTLATIRQCLGQLVFGEDDEELQDVVVRLLRRRGRTLALAEWATEGLLIDWLASAAGRGPDPEIAGGIVAASETALIGTLDIPADVLPTHRPASTEFTEAMAEAARRKFVADYALAVGPLVRISSAADAPVPVAVALVTPEGTRCRTVSVAGHPALQKVFLAKSALDLLRHELLAEKTEPRP